MPKGEAAATALQLPTLRKAHHWLRWFTKRWRLSHTPVEDDRPWFEASFVFQARDMAQAEFLFLEMEDGLKCPPNDASGEHVCPHFRVGGLHQLEEDDRG